MPAEYHFHSGFRITSDREAVWRALTAVDAWPSWWRWAKRIDRLAEATSADGVGARYRNRMASPLRVGFTYETTVAAVVPLRTMEVASTGDLEGRGRFDLADDPEGGTLVTFTWLVVTPRWWMSLLAKVGRPAFAWNHDQLMTAFGRGLASASGGELTEASHRLVGPRDAGYFTFPIAPGVPEAPRIDDPDALTPP
jgi:uncharacterized protein YndB with AHSA1/START domain